jgi:ACR3 family arsenite transporter
MVAGVALGKTAPAAVAALRYVQFGRGSQINAPIAILIWLMITPMMMKLDFAAVRNVGRRPRACFSLQKLLLRRPINILLAASYSPRIPAPRWFLF